MISDVLSETVDELDRYLDSDDWTGFYGDDDDPLVRRIRRLRDEADDIRRILDTVPPLPPTARSAAEGGGLVRRLLGITPQAKGAR